VSQGIGVRYTASGARVLGLERSENGLAITGIAVGGPGENLESFIQKSGFSLDDAVVAYGLTPGNFLSAFLKRDTSLSEEQAKSQITWEIERKMISGTSDYIIDYITADLGFIFAGRKAIIEEMHGSIPRFITDVEPVALYNGCDSVGEIGNGGMLLISVEADGISSVLLWDGELIYMDSYPVKEEKLSVMLAGMDVNAMKDIDRSTMERFRDYTMETIERTTIHANEQDKEKPEKILLAGCAVHIGDLPNMIGEASGITTLVSDPFAPFSDDITSRYPELSDKGAAFTTCFGLAARALED